MLGSTNIAGSLWHARRNESRACQPHFMWETLDNGVQHNTWYLSFSREEGQEVVLLVDLFPFYAGILFYLMHGSNNYMCYHNDASPPPSSRAYPGDLHLFFLLGGPFLNPGHTERDNASPPELLMDTNKPFVYKIDITILTSSPFSPVHTYTINWHFQKSLVWKAYSKISVESENREKKKRPFFKKLSG